MESDIPNKTTYLDLDSGAPVIKVERGENEDLNAEDTTMDLLAEEDDDDEVPIGSLLLPPGDSQEEAVNLHDILVDPLETECSPESPPPPPKRRRGLAKREPVPPPSPPPPVTRPPPKFTNKKQFTSEMETSIKNIVNECVCVLQRDPREYHPFYLRVYKFTTVGKTLGFIKSEKEVDSLWRKYDNFAKDQFEKWKDGGEEQVEFNGEHSPYLTAILTKKVIFQGKQFCLNISNRKDQKNKEKKFTDVDSVARTFRRDWLAREGTDKDARESLKHRLAFFHHVKHLTYPGDTARINRFWTCMLDGFPKGEWKDIMERQAKKYEEVPPPEVKRSGRARKVPNRFEVTYEVPETPSRLAAKERKEAERKALEEQREQARKEAQGKQSEAEKEWQAKKKKMLEELRKEQALKNQHKRKAIEGGECPHCGKVLRWQLDRHIREVHLKMKPVKRGEPKTEKVEEDEEEESKLEVKPGTSSDSEESRGVKAGGECPHCGKVLKRQLLYHIWRMHTTIDGKLVERPKRGDLKNLPEEERREHWKEWARHRRQNMTEDEKEEESRKFRERHMRKISSMTPQELEDYRNKNRFQQLQRRLERQNLPEEEKERLKTLNFIRRQAWMARKDKEWKEAKRIKVKERMARKRATMTAEQKEEQRLKHKEYRQNLTGEKLIRYRDSVRRSVKRYFERLKTENPGEYYNKTTGVQREKWDKMLIYQRERVMKETPEQREARLLRYRINQAKRRAKEGLEREGASEAEIERRLKQVEEEIKSQPKPVNSTYKPRPSARKPHNVPNPRLPPGEVKVNSEAASQNQSRSENYHPLLQPPLIPPPPSQIQHQQQLSQIEVAAPYQQILLQPQPPTLFAPFQEITLTSQASSMEFDPTPSLALVQCAGIPSSTVTISTVTSHTTSPSPMDTFDDGGDDDHGGPLSCGGGSYGDSDDEGNKEEINSYQVPSTSSYSLQDMPKSGVAGPSHLVTVSHVTPKAPESLPPSQLSLDELINVPVTLSANLHAAVNSEQVATEVKVDVPPSRQAAMCDECGKTFTTQFSVQLHKNVMHSLDPSVLICPRCQLACTSTISLWNHFSTNHLEDVDAFPKEYFPKRRNYPALPRDKTPYKQKRSDPNNPHFCDLCGKSFVQKCTLDDHIRRTHQGKGHICDVCGKDQQSTAKLWRHKVERHGMTDLAPPEGLPVVTCQYCNEILLRGYEQHVQKRHPEQYEEFFQSYVPEKGTAPRRRLMEKVKCPHCPSVIKGKLLNRHIRNIHSNKPRIPCPECGFMFKRLDHMRTHYKDQHAMADIEKKLEAKQLIKVHSSRSFSATCLLCQTDVMSKVVLRAHFVTEHHEVFQQCQISSLAIFQCRSCDEKFPKEQQLKSHMEAAHPDQLFTCQHCGALKYSQAELTTHERTHRHAERFKMLKNGLCEICDFDARTVVLSAKVEVDESGLTLGGGKRGGTSPAMKQKLELCLREHVKSEHPAKFFPCPNPTCMKFTTNRESFQNHMARCQKNGQLNSKEFVAGTVNPLPVFCSECGEVCRLRHLERHMKTKHDMKGTDEYPCEQCKPRIFKDKRYYVAHMHQVHQVPFDELLDLAPNDAPLGKFIRDRRSEKGSKPKPRKKGKGGSNRKRKRKASDDEEWEGSDKEMEWTEDMNENKEDDAGKEEKVPKRRKIGPKSKTQRATTPVKMGREEPVKKKRGRPSRKKSGAGGIKCAGGAVDVEKDKKLVISIERLSDDLVKYYLARRIVVKTEPES